MQSSYDVVRGKDLGLDILQVTRQTLGGINFLACILYHCCHSDRSLGHLHQSTPWLTSDTVLDSLSQGLSPVKLMPSENLICKRIALWGWNLATGLGRSRFPILLKIASSNGSTVRHQRHPQKTTVTLFLFRSSSCWFWSPLKTWNLLKSRLQYANNNPAIHTGFLSWCTYVQL